jgi:hypothetical protein
MKTIHYLLFTILLQIITGACDEATGEIGNLSDGETVNQSDRETVDQPDDNTEDRDVNSEEKVVAKRGIGSWTWRYTEKSMEDMSKTAGWFYTWKADRVWVHHPDNMEFVPMIYTADFATTENFEKAKRSTSGILLGFNEPDMKVQANMTAADALTLWPKFEETGLRLGSPAIAGDERKVGNWLDEFLKGTDNYKPKVDFICVHRYPQTNDPDEALLDLKNYLEGVYEKYKKPIWLTEFAMIKFGADQQFPTDAGQAKFAKEASEMMDDLQYVERYAWFVIMPYTAEPGFDVENIHLYDGDGNITQVGKAYRDAGLQD